MLYSLQCWRREWQPTPCLGKPRDRGAWSGGHFFKGKVQPSPYTPQGIELQGWPDPQREGSFHIIVNHACDTGTSEAPRPCVTCFIPSRKLLFLSWDNCCQQVTFLSEQIPVFASCTLRPLEETVRVYSLFPILNS